jgi:hypothetical protein
VAAHVESGPALTVKYHKSVRYLVLFQILYLNGLMVCCDETRYTALKRKIIIYNYKQNAEETDYFSYKFKEHLFAYSTQQQIFLNMLIR